MQTNQRQYPPLWPDNIYFRYQDRFRSPLISVKSSVLGMNEDVVARIPVKKNQRGSDCRLRLKYPPTGPVRVTFFKGKVWESQTTYSHYKDRDDVSYIRVPKRKLWFQNNVEVSYSTHKTYTNKYFAYHAFRTIGLLTPKPIDIDPSENKDKELLNIHDSLVYLRKDIKDKTERLSRLDDEREKEAVRFEVDSFLGSLYRVTEELLIDKLNTIRHQTPLGSKDEPNFLPHQHDEDFVRFWGTHIRAQTVKQYVSLYECIEGLKNNKDIEFEYIHAALINPGFSDELWLNSIKDPSCEFSLDNYIALMTQSLKLGSCIHPILKTMWPKDLTLSIFEDYYAVIKLYDELSEDYSNRQDFINVMSFFGVECDDNNQLKARHSGDRENRMLEMLCCHSNEVLEELFESRTQQQDAPQDVDISIIHAQRKAAFIFSMLRFFIEAGINTDTNKTLCKNLDFFEKNYSGGRVSENQIGMNDDGKVEIKVNKEDDKLKLQNLLKQSRYGSRRYFFEKDHYKIIVNGHFEEGKYQRKRGEGSFKVAKDYIAVDRNGTCEEGIALKFIKRDDVDTSLLAFKEIDIMRRLPKHPAIAKIDEVFRYDGKRSNFIAFMPRLFHLPPFCTDIDGLKKTTREIVEALSFLHGEGLIHGDIKLENIFRDGAGVLKISDYGLAICLQRNICNFDTIGGTYYPPRSTLDLGADWSSFKKIDTWAIGVMMLCRTDWSQVLPPDMLQDFQKEVSQIGGGIWASSTGLEKHAYRGKVLPSSDKATLFQEHITELIEKTFCQSNIAIFVSFGDLAKRCIALDPADRPTMDDILSHPFLTTS